MEHQYLHLSLEQSRLTDHYEHHEINHLRDMFSDLCLRSAPDVIGAIQGLDGSRSFIGAAPNVGPYGTLLEEITWMEEVPHLLTSSQLDSLPDLAASRPIGFDSGLNIPAQHQLWDGDWPWFELDPPPQQERADQQSGGSNARTNPMFVLPVHPPPPAARMDNTNLTHIQSRIMNGSGRGYGRLLYARPPFNVQPPLNVEIGIIEICTFFPGWTQIPQVNIRFQRNGIGRRMLAKMQLSAVGELSADNLTQTEQRIQKQNSRAGGLMYNHLGAWSKKYALEEGPQDDLTANTWSLATMYPRDRLRFGHVRLRDVYGDLHRQNWPTGVDRLFLTQCMEYAADHEELDLDTSHFDWIGRQIHVDIPPPPAGMNRDEDAAERFSVPDPAF